MAGQKTISCTYQEPIPPPVPPPPPDYVVTGNGYPSPNGNYFENGTYDARPKYTREDNAYELWQAGETQFVLSTQAGHPGVHSWMKMGGDITGNYPAWLAAEGTAAVALGV